MSQPPDAEAWTHQGPGDVPTLLVSDPRRGCQGKGMDITKTFQWKEMEHFSAFGKPDFLSKLMGTRACWVASVMVNNP